MTNEQTVNSGAHGVKWGLIIGVVYAVFVVLRHSTGAKNPINYSLLTVLGYASVLILLFISGRKLKNEAGGYIEMKEAFKSLFISVLIFEALFTITYFVYLKYVNPGFFDAFKTSSENMMLSVNRPQKEIDQLMETMDVSKQQILHASVLDFLRNYLQYVCISGIFAFLFALILRRKPPVFEQDNSFQS